MVLTTCLLALFVDLIVAYIWKYAPKTVPEHSSILAFVKPMSTPCPKCGGKTLLWNGGIFTSYPMYIKCFCSTCQITHTAQYGPCYCTGNPNCPHRKGFIVYEKLHSAPIL